MLFNAQSAFEVCIPPSRVRLGERPTEPVPKPDPKAPEPQPEEPLPFEPDPFPDFRDVPPMSPIDQADPSGTSCR
jgi:hypothetical protein